MLSGVASRRLGVLAALAGSCCAFAPGPAVAQEMIAARPITAGQQLPDVIAPMVDHYKGVTVWSENVRGLGGPDSNRHFLTASVGGIRARLPIAPRAGVPFDVDLGPGLQGNVVAAYSRCRTEAPAVPNPQRTPRTGGPNPSPLYTVGRGCDLYTYDFRTGLESKVDGASTGEASEMLPSIWGGRIAFARVYERRSGRRGTYPYLYTRPLGSGASNREPGGSRGIYGLPGPTSLDLYGRKLSFAWDYVNRGSRNATDPVSELRLTFTDSTRRRLLSQRDDGGVFLTPTGSRGHIHYGYQRVSGSSDQSGGFDSRSRQRLSYDISSGEKTVSGDVPGALLASMAVDGSTIVYGVNGDNGVWGAIDPDPDARILRDQLP